MTTSSSSARSSLLQDAYESDSPYQRHPGPGAAAGAAATANTSPDIFFQEEQSSNTNSNTSDSERSYTWKCADFGHTIGDRSRDGSIHVTDEVFNAASHLSATMLSILGTVLLITQSSSYGEPWKIVSFSIYGASLIFLFGASTLHHSIVGSPRVEAFLRMMDYLAIYPLIAGTFTPLTLVFYHDSSIGWAFAAVVWGIAIVGMVGTACYFVHIPKWLSMTMYITLGWMGACMTYWLIPVLGWQGFGLFLMGGIFYTAGGYVFSVEEPNPFPGRFGFHEIWHIAVITGAATHWCLMYFFVLPWHHNSDTTTNE